jgi:hypothetical protein
VSPVTSIVHWVNCSFLGNHDKITIKGNSAATGLKIFAFLGLFGSKIALSPVTKAKIVHSQARVTRHLNLWSKRYSRLAHHQKCPKQARHRHFAKADQDGSIARDSLSASCKVASRP